MRNSYGPTCCCNSSEARTDDRRLWDVSLAMFGGYTAVLVAHQMRPLLADNSGREIGGMLAEAGFADIEVKPTFGYWSIVTGRKA